MSTNPTRKWGWPYFWPISGAQGGLSEDSRIGLRGAFRYGEALDIRSDSGLISIASKVINDSGANVNKLIKWIEPALSQNNGDEYYYGQDTIYKRTTAGGGTYSVARTLSADSPNGQGLAEFNKFLFYRTATNLGMYDYTTWNDTFKVAADGLETLNTEHGALCAFKNYLLIANNNKVASLDQVGTFTANTLTLPPGYNARHIFRAGSVACVLATLGTNITDSSQGMLFTWRGASPNYDDYIPLNGNPHTGYSYNNKIYIITGNDPVLEVTQGGQSLVMQGIPNTGLGQTAEVYPGAMTMWRNLLHFGISAGTSPTIWRGAYTYGAKKATFDNVLNSEYPITTGRNSGTAVQITAIKQCGNSLRIAWKDTGNAQVYGIDKIDPTQFQPSAVYRSLYYDHGDIFFKVPNRVMVELAKPLLTGESVSVTLSGNPYSDPTFTDTTTLVTATQNTVGSVFLEIPVESQAVAIRSRDLHLQLQLTGPGTSTPQIKRVITFITPQSEVIGGPGS